MLSPLSGLGRAECLAQVLAREIIQQVGGKVYFLRVCWGGCDAGVETPVVGGRYGTSELVPCYTAKCVVRSSGEIVDGTQTEVCVTGDGLHCGEACRAHRTRCADLNGKVCASPTVGDAENSAGRIPALLERRRSTAARSTATSKARWQPEGCRYIGYGESKGDGLLDCGGGSGWWDLAGADYEAFG